MLFMIAPAVDDLWQLLQNGQFYTQKKASILPKFSHLDYYFVVKFPERESYIVSDLWTNLMIGSCCHFISFVFTYSILIIPPKEVV